MFSSRVRLLLAATCFAIGSAFLFWRVILAVPMFVAGALFVWGHWRYGTVWLAFQRYRKGDMDAVERLLNQVRDPASLQAQQRAYYEFLQGTVQVLRGHPHRAKPHFLRAIEGPLRTDRMRSITHAHLAAVELALDNAGNAESHAARARALGLPESLDAALGVLERQQSKGADGESGSTHSRGRDP
jgi:hypothetical protein